MRRAAGVTCVTCSTVVTSETVETRCYKPQVLSGWWLQKGGRNACLSCVQATKQQACEAKTNEMDNITSGPRAISALNQRLQISEFCKAHGISPRTLASYADMHIIAVADQRIPVSAKRGFLSTGREMERNAKCILVTAINMKSEHEYMCTTDTIASSLAREIRVQLENKAKNQSLLARWLSGTVPGFLLSSTRH